jgi:hypothetical protein
VLIPAPTRLRIENVLHGRELDLGDGIGAFDDDEAPRRMDTRDPPVPSAIRLFLWGGGAFLTVYQCSRGSRGVPEDGLTMACFELTGEHKTKIPTRGRGAGQAIRGGDKAMVGSPGHAANRHAECAINRQECGINGRECGIACGIPVPAWC